MSMTVTIGLWVEKEARTIGRCPSYYAADWERLETEAGEYPIQLVFENGYTAPMPYWTLVGIPARRLAGATYNGFGGANFSSNDLPQEPVKYVAQMYAYHLPEQVRQGLVKLLPEFAYLGDSDASWKHPDAPRTWEQVAELKATTERSAA